MDKGATTQNIYQLVKELSEGLKVGQSRLIDMPDDIKRFRVYLSDAGMRKQLKFVTRVKKNCNPHKLLIMCTLPLVIPE